MTADEPHGLRIDDRPPAAAPARRARPLRPGRRLAEHRPRRLRRGPAVRAHRARRRAVRPRRGRSAATVRWDEVEAIPFAPTVAEAHAWAFNCRFEFRRGRDGRLRLQQAGHPGRGDLHQLRRRQHARRLLDAGVLPPRGAAVSPADADPRARAPRPGARGATGDRPRAAARHLGRVRARDDRDHPGRDRGATGSVTRPRLRLRRATARPSGAASPARVFTDDVAGDRGVGVSQPLRPRLPARRAVRLPEPRRAGRRRRRPRFTDDSPRSDYFTRELFYRL